MTVPSNTVKWSSAALDWTGVGYRFTVEVDLGDPIDQYTVYEARQCLARDLEGLFGTKIRDLELDQQRALGPGRLSFVAPAQVFETDPAQLRQVVEDGIARGLIAVQQRQEARDTVGAQWLDRLPNPD